MQAEVKLHEPSLALDGGSEDGLDCLVKVCDGAVSMLRPGGFMAVETAGAQAAACRPLQARQPREIMSQGAAEHRRVTQAASRQTSCRRAWRLWTSRAARRLSK